MSPSPIDNLPALGTHIFQSLPGTFKLYFPALTAAQASDNWIQSAGEIRYGPEERHVADVYRPTTDPLNDASSVSGPLRTLIWVHGGGLSQGDKSLPMCRAVYANVGHFFASKGYLVIVTNYRLRIADTSDPRYGTASNAHFPSGGEDIALLLACLAREASGKETSSPLQGLDPKKVVLMGNSAGAVHCATFLYRDVIPGFSVDPVIQPQAVVFVSPPVAFEGMNPDRARVIHGYYGLLDMTDEKARNTRLDELSVLGLRRRSRNRTRCLVGLAELDPEDEILEPVRRFLNAHARQTGSEAEQLFIAGHNHLSVPLGLSLGGKEEQWGYDVDAWIKKL